MAQLLLVGAILTPGQRTVAATLRHPFRWVSRSDLRSHTERRSGHADQGSDLLAVQHGSHPPEQENHAATPPVSAGRTPVRTVLYMGALAASRYHPVIRAFHQRMLADGKAWKVALATCMRALLAVLYGMVKSGLHSIPDTVVS